jgi:2-polyprenyl-3-methyl-5-hydroxy-6-metoxy-1,4-benzoquinol methylase
MEMHSVACPVCGYHQFKMEFQVIDYFVTKEEFCIQSCIKCGMHLTADVPADSEISAYYKSEDYISHSDTRKGLVNRAYHIVRDYMLARKYTSIRRSTGKNKGTILDIGAGTGYFLHYMKKKNWEVYGTEKSVEAREFAKKHRNLDILPEDALFSLPTASFDAITLWHVMEHLPNIRQYWQIISKLLKPDGILIIALPNSGSWDAKHYGSYWAAWDVPRHLWHFTPKHIEKSGDKEGFRLIHSQRMPFDAFYISIMSEKYKKSAFPILKGIFFGKISWLSSLFNKNRCSSLMYIFRKSV